MKKMNQMLNKLVLVSTMLFTLGLNANAQNAKVKFINRSWDGENKEVVNTTKSITDYTVIEGNHAGDWYQLGVDDGKDHYYVVNGEANYQTLNTFGRAHLILCDGASLTITGGIKVENNAHIFIYGQKNDSGKLTVTNSYDDAAGIGSAKGVNCGDITIHGGDISATAYDGAGIGGGEDRSSGNITIYGGKVYGSGDKGNGAGIGGGYAGSGSNIIIYGGEVTAQGGKNAAGIGGGEKYNGGGAMGDVTIWGGTVTATGGEYGAGIGGGRDCQDNYGTLTVNGGIVKAKGAHMGAGIGGGYQGNGCKVVINDGNVRATGSREGAAGYASSAAIGGGSYGAGGDVTINGGTVRAECVVYSTYTSLHAEYIGRGYQSSDNGKLTLGDGVRVYDNFHTPHEWAPVDERVDYTAAARGYKDDYILIETCTHDGFEYVDQTHHKIVCSHCKMDGQLLEHDLEGGNCTICSHALGELHNEPVVLKSVSGPQGISKFDGQITVNEPIYDLSGHKYEASMLTSGQLPKGIYIQGGKKFMVK